MSDPADATLPLVRASVKSVLERSPAFRALPREQRLAMAQNMVKVARYIVDAGGETAGTPMTATVRGLADRADQVRDLGRPGRTSGQQFADQGGARAAQSGGEAYTGLISRVNFPAFVGGLVEGVFDAIVTSSIRQMEAYSTMVANIAKSVDEYMRDNITPNQARDYLADKYPDHLRVDTTGGAPKLVPKQPGGSAPGPRGPRGPRGPTTSQGLAVDGFALPDFMKDLGLPAPVSSLNPNTIENTLVPGARRRMAMDRQELLATMVLMGINRLIVTDGKISASCLFELDTTDSIYGETTTASSFDEHVTRKESGWRFWFVPTSSTQTTSNFNVSTTNFGSSEADSRMHAELSGNVDINFRSESFPLEKIADVLQIREIEDKAPQAAAAPTLSPPPGMTLPPPPPLPPLPGTPAPAPARTPAPAAGGGG
jgi:hypothetical protein